MTQRVKACFLGPGWQCVMEATCSAPTLLECAGWAESIGVSQISRPSFIQGFIGSDPHLELHSTGSAACIAMVIHGQSERCPLLLSLHFEPGLISGCFSRATPRKAHCSSPIARWPGYDCLKGLNLSLFLFLYLSGDIAFQPLLSTFAWLWLFDCFEYSFSVEEL